MRNFTLTLFVALMITGILRAQEWTQNLPQEKLDSGTLSFYEIQDAFYSYWEPFNVEEGHYLLNGEKVKARGYNHFKRWEWYWENRIDPATGAFPDMRALDEYYMNASSTRSLSGNWTSLGPNTSPGGYAGLGRLNCVAFVPGSTTEYYAGAASGGIWHTIDDGASWTVLNDTVPVLGVSDILLVDPVMGPDILYIATGDRDGGSLWSLGGQQSNDNNSVGVLKSIDGGNTWTTTGLSFTVSQKVRVNRLLMDPTSAYQTIYAATTQGLYKTTDAGVNWTLLTAQAFIDMEFKPGSPSTIYASTKGGSSSIYYSTNSGSTWTLAGSYTSDRIEIAVSAHQPNWVYALAVADNSSGSGLLGVYRSTNSGVSYNQVFSGATLNLLGWSCSGQDFGGDQGWYDLCIAVDPNNASVVYVGGVNTWKSTDGGATFNIVNHWTGCGAPSNAQNVHADKHYLAFQNGSSTLFECNDGGLYKTSDGGTTWTHLSNGMAISQIYRFGVGQQSADEVIIGLQDNGTKARISGTWNDVIGGDGFECIVDYTSNSVQYGSLYYGSVYRTYNSWGNSTNITGSLPGSGWWCTPYLMDPVNNNTLYIGYSDVWKSTDQGNNWTQISNQGSTTDFRNMAICAGNTGYIYAATLSNIYRTTNGGNATQAWTDITSNLPVGVANITYVSVKHNNPQHIWVSMGGYNNHGVYESTNGGGSWTNISSGLPQLPVMCVIQNTQYSGIELYAATDVGVYVKRDGNNWTQFSNGLPNAVVAELEIYYDADPDNSKIYAGTFGRGVWSSDLYNPYVPPVADFSGSPTSGLPPLPVIFTDLSQNTVTSWFWNFGDGNISMVQNPAHSYNDPGLYTVKLVVSGPGGSDSTTKTDYIQVNYFPPTADFTADITSGIAPLMVNFTDLSLDSVDTWNWDFGDGNTSTEQHPQHAYNDPGMFTVSLTVSGPGGSNSLSKTDYIVVNYAPPTAGFLGYPTTGMPPLDVTFNDLSADSVDSWSWNFGDGATSSLRDPEHTYTESGAYTVSLTVSGPGGSDTETKTNYITVSDTPPIADFSGDPTSGFFPLQVYFTDLSSGAITDWKWYFGDGSTSTIQDPSHTYDVAGNYSVSLRLDGPGGSDSISKENYITVLVGVEEHHSEYLKIFPNPCGEFIIVRSERPVKNVSLADLIGNIVYDEKVKETGPYEKKISMLEMNPGIYFCRIVLQNGNLILTKVMKE